MDAASIPWLVTLLGALVLGLGFVIRRSLRVRAVRARLARARRGERSARALLTGHGYAIQAEQARGELVLSVDGAPSIHPVRADYLVCRGADRYVAEVKTGERAPCLDHAPTRRQLLEYRAAFGVDVVLLVDPEAGTVREVTLPAGRAPGRAIPFVLGLALGIATSVVVALAARGW